MKSFRFDRVSSSLLVSLLTAACSLQFNQAALAQATVLTGKVATVSHVQSVPLVSRQAQYDYSPPAVTHYVGPTVVQTTTRTYSGNAYDGSRNFHPQRPLIRTVYVQDNRTFFQRHPKVKAASIGAGVGAGAGALTGLVTGNGVVRGALIGGGAGAGVGLVRSSNTLKRHPIMRDVATGSLVGLGLGAAGSRGHRRALQATGVGAAIGLGVGMFKHLR